MAERAHELLAGSGWIPEPLRTSGRAIGATSSLSTPARRQRPLRLKRNRRRPDTKRPWPILKGRPKMRVFLPNSSQSLPNRKEKGCHSRRLAAAGEPSSCRGLTMSIQPSDLARRLAEQAERVCRHYLSNGRRIGHYWIVGDARNTAGRSMFVRLRGPGAGKGAAGKWTDAATGEHGDLLDVIRESCGLVEFSDILAEAHRYLSLPPCELTLKSRHSMTPAPAGSPESARRLFAVSKPIRGTIAETYLRRRGISALHADCKPPFPPTLLLHTDQRLPNGNLARSDRRGHYSQWRPHRRPSHLA